MSREEVKSILDGIVEELENREEVENVDQLILDRPSKRKKIGGRKSKFRSKTNRGGRRRSIRKTKRK